MRAAARRARSRTRPSDGAARSSSSSRYSASVWAWVPAAPSAPDAADVVAVHVPLDERDVVIARAARRVGRAHGRRRRDRARSSTSWWRAEHRLVAVGRQRPIGVRPVQVAVGVDHLGFDPDAEVHAQRADMVDQRIEPVGMCVRRHDPVAETRRSLRRDPNQPSSSTNRSTPTARRGRPARAACRGRGRSTPPPTCSPAPGAASSGWPGATAGERWNCRLAAVRPRRCGRRRPRACGTTRPARAPPRRGAAARPAAGSAGRRPAARRAVAWLPLQARWAPHI